MSLVEMESIAAANDFHGVRYRIGLRAADNEMNVVGHQALSQDFNFV